MNTELSRDNHKKNWALKLKAWVHSGWFVKAEILLALSFITFVGEFLVWKCLRDLGFFSCIRGTARSWPIIVCIRNACGDDTLKEYSGIVVAVLEAIVVALLTITLTMYTFLKGNLDRSIDDNPYLSSVASIFQKERANRLIRISVFNLLSMVMILLWHYRIEFGDIQSRVLICLGFWTLLFALAANAANVYYFWKECIQLREGLTKVCINYGEAQIKNIRALLAKRFGINVTDVKFEEYLKLILFLIGDWSEWHTDELDKYRSKQAEMNLQIAIKGYKIHDPAINDKDKAEIENLIRELVTAGEKMCSIMKRDEFINFFSRTEALLLNSNKKVTKGNYDENEIVTLIQERSEVLEPIINPENNREEAGIEVKDLQEFKYDLGDENDGDIIKYIDYFRRRVGYTHGDDNYRNDFLDETEKLYKYLREYRNVKVSLRQLGDNTADVNIEKNVALGMYYFYLRVLCVFCIAVNIHDYTDNGSTMNFADFYASTMEKVTLYSSQFYHTVFARSKWLNCVLDVSAFDNVLFYNTRFTQTSMNNCHFREVIFKNAQMNGSMLDRGMFDSCGFENSVFNGASLNNSVFKSTSIKGADFSNAQMENIGWEDSGLCDSTLENAVIKNWEWESQPKDNGYLEWKNNDYTGASIEEVKWTNMDLNNSIFSKADMPGISFEKCRLSGTVFDQANLAGSEIKECERHERTEADGLYGKCSFKNVNFYNSSISMSDFPDSNFYGASFTEADIKECNLKYGDFNDASFKRAKLEKNDFSYDRLHEASFSSAIITECIFDNALADRMLFTYVDCGKSCFKKTAMDDSIFSDSKFEKCELNAAGVSGSVFYGTVFDDCSLIHVDFSGGRFADTRFMNGTRFQYCNFSDCKFERIELGDTQFFHCNFNGAEFVECGIDKSNTVKCKGLRNKQGSING